MALKRKPVYADSFGTMAENPSDARKTAVPETKGTSSGNDTKPSRVRPDDEAAETNQAEQETPEETSPSQDKQDEAPTPEEDVPESPAAAPPEPAVVESPTTPPDEPAPTTASRLAASVPAPAPEQEQSSSRPRTAATRSTPTGQRARKSVEDAYLLARRRPEEWGPAPIRLTKAIKRRLDGRRAQDHRELGHKFSLNHYHNAALANIPEDVEEAIRWAEDYVDELGLSKPETIGTTTRLHRPVAERMNQLSSELPARARFGLLWYLQTAAVKRLLDALDVHDIGAIDLDEET